VMMAVNDESDLDRIYMMNRRGAESILFIMFILSTPAQIFTRNPHHSPFRARLAQAARRRVQMTRWLGQVVR